MRITFFLNPHGELACPYTDQIDLRAFGTLSLTRASTIEWDATTQEWVVTWIQAPWPTARFATREEATIYEQRLLSDHLPKYLGSHPLA